MSNFPNFDELDKEKQSHQQTENLDNSINLSQNFQYRIDVPNDIENINIDINKENNQSNDYRGTTPNLNVHNKNSYQPNNNYDLAGRNNFAQQNAVSNYSNIDDKNIPNQNNVNDNSSNNASNGEDITNVSIDTLDETVSETLKREFKRICFKLECVLLPRFNANKNKEIHNWDLWGPLLFCLILSATLSFTPSTDSNSSTTGTTTVNSEKTGNGNIFIILFFIFWIGGIIITMNSRFLGSNLNIFQSLCLLGYCIFPIDIAALIIRLINAESFVKVIIVGVCLLWSCFSSIGFMSGFVESEKKMVCVYPIFLFYLVISWFVLAM